MDPGKKELLKREGSQERILENLDGQVCLREPVVKTMLDPRFEVCGIIYSGRIFELVLGSRFRLGHFAAFLQIPLATQIGEPGWSPLQS